MIEPERVVRLFRIGRNQALRIPGEFEGDGAILREEGERLIVEPVCKELLLKLRSTLEPLDEEFPDIDSDLQALNDMEL